MTTAESTSSKTSAPSPVPKRLPPGRYDLLGLMQSEWTKLRTVRSTTWTLCITIVVGIGVSALASAETSAHWASMSVGSKQNFDPTWVSLAGTMFCQLVMGVLGVLVVSAEYGTGTIRATFAAAPKRMHVLIAKVAVFGAVALIVSELTSFLSFFLGQSLLTHAPHATLSSPGALRAVVGTGLYLCVMSIFALGLASIIRHTAGAISAYVGVLLVVPIVLGALPTSIQNDVHRYLPLNIGAAVAHTRPSPGTFDPWIGMLILCAYAAVALLIGGTMLVRRDV